MSINFFQVRRKGKTCSPYTLIEIEAALPPDNSTAIVGDPRGFNGSRKGNALQGLEQVYEFAGGLPERI